MEYYFNTDTTMPLNRYDRLRLQMRISYEAFVYRIYMAVICMVVYSAVRTRC